MRRFLPLLCWILCSPTLPAWGAAPPSDWRDGEGAGNNWPGHNGASDESAYSRLTQIDTGNVGRLGLSWFLDLPDERMLEATPLDVNGVLYFTGSYSRVYAVNAASGKLLWTHDPQVWQHNPDKFKLTLPVNRGAAYANGRVFVATVDGRLIALDAKTGRLLWSVQSVPLESRYTINAAPRVLHGRVLIGSSGGDFGERGCLTAYDAASGRRVWRFYVVPDGTQNQDDPAMERAAATWDTKPAGGAPWDSVTVDVALNRIYVGTGNPSPNDPADRGASGDNLYTASIVALDADSGKYLWHYQVNPRDAWDFDAAEQMVLADLRIEGRRTRVLMQAPKNGFFYVLDRVTGKLLSAQKLGKATWADHIDLSTGRPVDTPNNRYEEGPVNIWPSAGGAHAWQSMAFSPQTGLVYVPTMQVGVRYGKGAGQALYGGLAIETVHEEDRDNKGALIAWDPVSQKARWTIQQEYPFNGGVLATAGGLVFQGAADGYLCVYDAGTGARLWQFNAGLGIIAAPISYMVGKRQYVSVLVGYGATNMMGVMNAGWKFGAQPRRLLTFALDGKATLPPGAAQDFTVHAVDDPALQINDDDVQRGAGLFTLRCSGCHGIDVVSAGPPAPDLRESQVALRRDGFARVVHDGVLVSLGMPAFTDLGDAQLNDLYVYIRAKARQALPGAP
jgi:quinohemoprotein ethanol dehydrogenase